MDENNEYIRSLIHEELADLEAVLRSTCKVKLPLKVSWDPEINVQNAAA